MKKEIFNIIFLSVIALLVAWLYWPQDNAPRRHSEQEHQNYILAISWQPAFCESKPNKPECRSQRKGRYDANNFSLHGLWPQPRDNVYCGVPTDIIKIDKRGLWNELPKLKIEGRVRNELARRMPGYSSYLHRHEWYKHGTCVSAGLEPQHYFELSIDMIDEINKTPLRELFAQNIGKEITATQIAKATEMSFGKGAGKRINITCKRDGRRTLITELKISMGFETDIHTIASQNENLNNAPKLFIGCKRGIVDLVGLQ